LEEEFFTHTGYWSGLWNWPIPVNGTPEGKKNRKRKFTLDRVMEWVEKYENIDGRFCFFDACARFSPLYQQIVEATSFNEEHWLNGCGMHGKTV
jgi:hypothetical protein